MSINSKGFMMIARAVSVSFVLLVLAIPLRSAFAQNVKEVTVYGTVTDSAGEKIPSAMVVLQAGMMNNSRDTVFTDSAGFFTQIVLVNQNAYAITYHIFKSGYAAATGYGIIDARNDVNLRTIVLQKDPGQTRVIRGVVKDSLSDKALAGALCRYSAIRGVRDTVHDSTFTEKDGSFSIRLQFYDRQFLQYRITYSITKTGYEPKTGTKEIQGLTTELGTVLLSRSAVSILKTAREIPSTRGTCRIRVYAMDGRLMYTGEWITLHTPGGASAFGRKLVIISPGREKGAGGCKKEILD